MFEKVARLFRPEATTTVEYGPTLEALAKKANHAHESGRGAMKRGVEMFRIAGQALIEAKASPQIVHGTWMDWLKLNCPQISDRQARRYMELAKLDVTSDLEEGWARINGNAEKQASDPHPAQIPPVSEPMPAGTPPLPAPAALAGAETPAAVSSPPRPRLVSLSVPSQPSDQAEGPVEEPRDSKRTWVYQDAELTCRIPRPHVPDSEFLAALKHACLELETNPSYPRLAA